MFAKIFSLQHYLHPPPPLTEHCAFVFGPFRGLNGTLILSYKGHWHFPKTQLMLSYCVALTSTLYTHHPPHRLCQWGGGGEWFGQGSVCIMHYQANALYLQTSCSLCTWLLNTLGTRHIFVTRNANLPTRHCGVNIYWDEIANVTIFLWLFGVKGLATISNVFQTLHLLSKEDNCGAHD